jgi:uncharacterized coiled-coil protein SlyX
MQLAATNKKEITEDYRDMVRNVQTILLSMITAGIIALFGFIWSINGQIIEMRTESAFRYKSIEEANILLKTIQTDLNNMDSRITTLEEKFKRK